MTEQLGSDNDFYDDNASNNVIFIINNIIEYIFYIIIHLLTMAISFRGY